MSAEWAARVEGGSVLLSPRAVVRLYGALATALRAVRAEGAGPSYELTRLLDVLRAAAEDATQGAPQGARRGAGSLEPQAISGASGNVRRGPEMPSESWVTASAAVEFLTARGRPVSERRVRQLAAQGVLERRQVGRRVEVSRQSLLALPEKTECA